MDATEEFKVAEIELVYKNPVRAKDRPKITGSRDAYDVLINRWDQNKIGFVEQAKVLLLDRANRVLGLCDISTGGVAGTIFDPRVVFAAAIKANASSIIMAHNHPSGNLQQSRADEALTDKFRNGGKLLDITLHDHLIVSLDGYYSFSDDMSYSLEYIQEGRMEKKLTL